MLERINKIVPVWFYLFVFWMFLPEATVGFNKHEARDTMISEQLQDKLEAVSHIRNQCQKDSLCNFSGMSGYMDERKKAGMFALLAGLTVTR